MGEINHLDIGFMQGRLSDIKDQKIQQFPYDNWSNEFYLAKKNNFTKIEWTIDLETLPLNPIYSKEGRNEIIYYKDKYNIKIESLTGDLFMQKPFWKNIGSNQKVLKNLFLKTINCSKKVGIKYIILPLVDNGSISNSHQERVLVSFLKSIQKKLRENKQKILFETDFPPLKNLRFIKKFNPNFFGINYDTGNSAHKGFNNQKELKLLFQYIKNIHIKDRLLNRGTVPLGKGNYKFDTFFRFIKKNKYKGNLILQTARSKNKNHLKNLIKYRNFVIKKFNNS